ncbi:hypothetical protein M9Y10_037832 [Tritrichomonas musculus]|uniref:Uncharacterized protein n=1 Tax=Tritrichomonas musculus TaxID=1915356 RepID=A0ABR2GJ08_9EUKA
MSRQQQQQLAILEEAMKSRKQIEILTEETNRLKEKLSSRQEILNRLQQLCLSSATLLGSVDSTSTETEPSSLKLLTKLDQSTAVVPTEDENDDDQIKLIVGKYLNQLLAVIYSIAEEANGNVNIMTLINMEDKLHQLFAFAESKGIIPVTNENQSWKKGVLQHKPISDKIKSIMAEDDQDQNEDA